MRTRRLLISCVVLIALIGMAPSRAFAANTTCANADFLFPGERASYSIAASGSLFFKARVTAGRSYAVFVWGPTQDAGEGGASLGVDFFSDNTCTSAPAGTTPGDYEPFVFGLPDHNGDHDSLIPAADGSVYIRVSNFVASAYTAHVLFIETTLFSPWWFTGGTNQAYIEIRNSMNGGTTAQVTIYAANGTVCGTTNVAVPGNGNTAVVVNNVGTCAASLSGSSQIAFAGTPGGITANTTTIDVPNGTSFDSPFSPRMVWTTFDR